MELRTGKCLSEQTVAMLFAKTGDIMEKSSTTKLKMIIPKSLTFKIKFKVYKGREVIKV